VIAGRKAAGIENSKEDLTSVDCKEVISELKALGTEQNRKIYRRYGVVGEVYGVSYADLERLKKKIKVNHELATQLWATGNHDARILSTKIADPALMSASVLDAWVKDLGDYVVANAFALLASRASSARQKMEKWSKSKDEQTGSVGWMLLGQLAMNDLTLPDDYFEPYLDTIERDIHNRPNRVRYVMNSALIAIGIRNPALQKRALDAAKKIGKVEVDHGETDCKTPDAAAYILKAASRKRARC
jgi:3-methyladenine DNA glycosylase AlkD